MPRGPDHAAIRARETEALELGLAALSDLPGIAACRVPDPTGNPLERVQIDVDAEKLGAGAAVITASARNSGTEGYLGWLGNGLVLRPGGVVRLRIQRGPSARF